MVRVMRSCNTHEDERSVAKMGVYGRIGSLKERRIRRCYSICGKAGIVSDLFELMFTEPVS